MGTGTAFPNDAIFRTPCPPGALMQAASSLVGKAYDRLCDMDIQCLRLCPPYSCSHSAVLLLREIEQLAAHEIYGRLVVLLDVVERVGDDLDRPDETSLYVLEKEQMHGAEDQPTEPNREPDQRGVVRK